MSVTPDAEHWRERAIEARALAGCMTDPEAKRAMLGVAEDCDNLAVLTEEQKEPAP